MSDFNRGKEYMEHAHSAEHIKSMVNKIEQAVTLLDQSGEGRQGPGMLIKTLAGVLRQHGHDLEEVALRVPSGHDDVKAKIVTKAHLFLDYSSKIFSLVEEVEGPPTEDKKTKK